MRAVGQSDVLTGLTLLSGLVYNRQTIRPLFPRSISWTSCANPRLPNTLTQQGIGGLEQGERKLEALLEVVELRFADAAESLAAPIRAIDEVPRLNQLLRTAIQASSFEEFRTVFFG